MACSLLFPSVVICLGHMMNNCRCNPARNSATAKYFEICYQRLILSSIAVCCFYSLFHIITAIFGSYLATNIYLSFIIRSCYIRRSSDASFYICLVLTKIISNMNSRDAKLKEKHLLIFRRFERCQFFKIINVNFLQFIFASL